MKTRTTSFLKRLITEHRTPNNPRVWERDVVRGVMFRSTYRGRFDEIRRYLAGVGKRPPGDNAAFLIGESLRKPQPQTPQKQATPVPWCSGLLMLWLCGHYDVVVHALALWLRGAQTRPEWRQLRGRIPELLLPPLENAASVFKGNPLDDDPNLLGAHLRTTGMEAATLNLLVQQNPAIAAGLQPNSNEARFIFREEAKSTWYALSPYMDDIARIVETLAPEKGLGGTMRANVPEFSELTQHDQMVSAMIELGAATTISMRAQETALLAMFRQWMNDLEYSDWSPWRFDWRK